MKTIKLKVMWAVLVSLEFSVCSMGAMPALLTPTANLTEKWPTNDSNWKSQDVETKLISSCWTSNKLTLTCAAQDNKNQLNLKIIGSTNASDSRFVGNYNLRKIEAVQFDVQTSGGSNGYFFGFTARKSVIPKTPSWTFASKGYIPLNTAGQWVKVNIPLAYSENWTTAAYNGDPDTRPISVKFNEDKDWIETLFIMLQSLENRTDSSAINVTNFKLIGPWAGPFTNEIPVAWLAEYGLSVGDIIDDGADKDKDGQSNRYEFLASTDPSDSNDVFKVEIERTKDGQVVLKWKENNRYAKYDLMQGTDLNDPGTFKTNATFSNMQGSGLDKQANMGIPAVTGARFYKVVIKQ